MTDIAEIESPRQGGHYSVIYWVPFGIPGTHDASHIAIGLLYARKDGAGAIGLLDAASLEPVEVALGAKQVLSTLDWALIETIQQRHKTPAQAHEKWPGTRPSCYQVWMVSAPWPIVHSRSPEEVIRGMWTRTGGLPLVTVESWTSPPRSPSERG